MIEFLNTVALSDILFYVFSATMVLAAVGTISSRNPVHSVLFLILAFFNGAALFILLTAELVALLTVVVYVGAVAVLFLFVVMMLDIRKREAKKVSISTKLIITFVITALASEIWMLMSSWKTYQGVMFAYLSNDLSGDEHDMLASTNALEIGRVLYTDYFYLFQLAGIILLVAMIGAIVLTLRQREDVRRQNVSTQLKRNKENSLERTKPEIGKGV